MVAKGLRNCSVGKLMLRFPRDPDPSRMIRNLQRLLRVSRFA